MVRKELLHKPLEKTESIKSGNHVNSVGWVLKSTDSLLDQERSFNLKQRAEKMKGKKDQVMMCINCFNTSK